MRFITASLLAVVLAATITGAHAQEGAALPLQRGSYAILQGGWNATAPTNTFNGFLGATSRAKLKQGWAISGAGGYKWSNGLRAELEFSYHRNSFRNFDIAAVRFSGRQVTASAMVNALYDINTGTRVTPYIGGGIGVSMVWMKNLTQLVGPSAPILGVFNNESARVAYQGIVGVAVAIAPQLELLIDTRYRASDGHTFRQTPNSFRDYNVHEITVMAGLRYAF